jgi:hypothetical protein
MDVRSLKQLIPGNDGRSIRDSYAHQLRERYSGE